LGGVTAAPWAPAGPGSNQGSCRARVTAGRGSNLPYRAGLLPRPAVTRVPAGPGLLPGAGWTPHYVTVGRNNTEHSESPRKRKVLARSHQYEF